jgi:hypothetical protein
MLCFICLKQNRDEPNRAVTHVLGTAVCREHVNSTQSSGNGALRPGESWSRLYERLNAKNVTVGD